MRTIAATLALLLVPQDRPSPPEGPITLSIQGGDLRIRIVPDGTMTMDTDETDDAPPRGQPPIPVHTSRDLGFASYRRIAALVAPARRWAGGEMPCASSAPWASGRAAPGATIVVLWEADGKQVMVPMSCGYGPAANEIELVRAAMDQVWDWTRAPVEAFEGATNATETMVPEHGE